MMTINSDIVRKNAGKRVLTPNKMLAITPLARAVLDRRRLEIAHETGVLKPRYEIASEAIINHFTPTNHQQEV